jgi:predicted acetyltransferase
MARIEQMIRLFGKTTVRSGMVQPCATNPLPPSRSPATPQALFNGLIAMDLVLRVPGSSEEPEFLRAHRATSESVPTFLHYYEEGMSFGRYLEVLAERERGEKLPANQAPSTFLFAFDGSRIVGRVSIRHALNPFLERWSGHIGYVVVPEYRRQGYGTAILRQALQIARQKLGLTRVLVTCDDDNIGSARVIEKNGGVLENVVAGPDGAKPKRRYWIATSD